MNRMQANTAWHCVGISTRMLMPTNLLQFYGFAKRNHKNPFRKHSKIACAQLISSPSLCAASGIAHCRRLLNVDEFLRVCTSGTINFRLPRQTLSLDGGTISKWCAPNTNNRSRFFLSRQCPLCIIAPTRNCLQASNPRLARQTSNSINTLNYICKNGLRRFFGQQKKVFNQRETAAKWTGLCEMQSRMRVQLRNSCISIRCSSIHHLPAVKSLLLNCK